MQKHFTQTMRETIPLLLLTLLTLLTACGKTDYDLTDTPMEQSIPSSPLTHIINPDSEVRGIWIASVYNIDYPSRTDLTSDQLKSELDAILDTCERTGLNTVFFQVRPHCDALYDSDIFPVSSVISSGGTLVFDPLEYLVSEGHRRNIFIHAWVNPLRVTMNSHDIESLPESSPARQNPSWTVAYGDGKLYLNAGVPEVRDLIADGVREIVTGYDVDGIVFDDYFYPYPAYDDSGKMHEFNDAYEYARYGEGFDDIADWRRDNINRMIRLCYDAVHTADPECVFGVSPFGVWQNNDGKNGGSNTTSLEAYNSLYCDALAWIEGGYVDYISPQVYWTFDTKSAPFDVVTRWWNQHLDGTDVKLYVSHASYRYEDGEWVNPQGQLTEQISFARSEKAYHGSIMYGYDEINRNINSAADDLLKAYENEIVYTPIQSTARPVTVSSPENGAVMTEEKTYIIGASDPAYPLTVTHGDTTEKVGRTKSGYFSLYVTLEKGENIFTFEQNGKTTEYTLHYGSSHLKNEETEPAPEEDPDAGLTILDSHTIIGTYPSLEIATSEDILWVSCVSPVGADVKVNIGGVETPLVPLDQPKKAKTDAGYVGVIYGANAKLPPTDDGTVTDCGNIVFTSSLDGISVEEEGIRVRVLGENAPLAVTVKENFTELKITPTSSYYNDYTVQSAGMTDYAVSLRNGFYQLKMGGYVAVENVTETDSLPSETVVISSAKVSDSGKTTDLVLACTDRPAYNGAVDENGRFVLTFYGVRSDNAPMPTIQVNPLIRSCELIRLDDRVRYCFTLVNPENFYGFDLTYGEGEIVVSMKNPMAVDFTSDQPLSGVNIVLDAGHGGWDRGAAGADSSMNEKDVNLAVTLKAAELLTDLGADITLTREDDTYSDLFRRMNLLEEWMPDLCISVHQNSMGHTTDITRVRGTLALYTMDSGVMLADAVGRSVADAFGRNFRGAQYQALAICRNPKFPSALIEVGFITSVEEYEATVSGEGILTAAQGIADGVLNYFRRQAAYLD
ncbi:MAG: family 10 glycosylhydrolase [Clostridia bacterium]|nr:family 10 glycosylhydrolase [Clostridia bacterium]